MTAFEIKKYKTKNNIILHNLNYKTLIKAIKEGYNLSLYNNTFIKLTLKDKRNMEEATILDYSNNKPFVLFGLSFKQLDNNHFITKQRFGDEDIVLNNGYLKVSKNDTLLSVFNKLNNGLQFYLIQGSK